MRAIVKTIAVAIWLFGSLAWAQARSDAPAQKPPLPIQVSIPTPPTAFRGDSQWRLCYEIFLTNLSSAAWTVQRINVKDESGAPLLTVRGKELDDVLSHPALPADNKSGAAADIAPGEAVIAYIEVKDGIPENSPPADSKDGTPPEVKLAVEMTMETVGGNHVNLDLGGGVYAIYAHLQPGSIRVKLGDKVTPGQVIALLGNSGHAGEPHLHFQLMNRNSLLNSDGLPYYFSEFKLAGRISGDSEGQLTESPMNLKVNRLPTPEAQHGDIPLENELVDFEP